MSKFSERAAAALELLPEELQEQIATYLVEEADKLEWLRREVALGIADAEAGRVVPWNPDEFFKIIEDHAAAADRE